MLFALVGDIDTGLDAPKQVRRKREPSLGSVVIANLANEFIDPKDLLDDEDARSLAR